MKAVTHLEKVITGEVSAVTHLEKVIAGETSAVTYTEKVIAGEAPAVTHLQKVIAGEASPVTHLEYIWAGGSPTPTEHEYTGVVPYSFNADGSPLIDWIIYGNMQQTGTPTPTTPIQPQECGDLETEGTKAGQYKIPILSASTTTPVYLGEVETTRKIKKIVFVGSEDENWSGQSAGGGAIRFRYTISNSVQADTTHLTSICTHLPLGVEGGTWNTDNIYTISNNYLWVRFDSSFTTTASLKSWLAQQYANGTPFTVYYTLATPETAVVNEPIRKISTYADTLSMEQAGVSIPTNNGSTTVDVETTLKPSEVYIKYKGV